jgi:chloramphenicol 3-O phosphotransferase
MMSPIQIIFLNGASSAGKSSIAKQIQAHATRPFLHISIDKMIELMPAKLNDWEGGLAPDGFSWKTAVDSQGFPIQELQMGPFAKKICQTFREVVVCLAKQGHLVIVDEVVLGKESMQQWRDQLKKFRVLYVGIYTPIEVLEQREKQRGDRIGGSARWQASLVHQEVTYDLEFDSSIQTPHETANAILHYVA